jgi:hypothetical protein
MVESMTDQLGWGLISTLCQYPNKFADCRLIVLIDGNNRIIGSNASSKTRVYRQNKLVA